jgi:SAM-dependent methyltransferase
MDPLLNNGFFRKLIWKCWYPFLTRRLEREEVLFLNYAYEEDPPMALPLAAANEPDRACIQLYHRTAAQVDLRGKQVLEVSCGHGGGASYLARALGPASYTGLDLNPAGVAFCQKRHAVPGLSFVRGDAQKLPFADGSFDAVVNVEASHCYPNFPAFLAEVARVLRPGGHFLYTDFRSRDRFGAWETALADAPLILRSQEVINAHVLRGMEKNSRRSLDLIHRHLPKCLHALGRDFAGIQGSRVHRDLESGEMSYRVYCFEKA